MIDFFHYLPQVDKAPPHTHTLVSISFRKWWKWGTLKCQTEENAEVCLQSVQTFDWVSCRRPSSASYISTVTAANVNQTQEAGEQRIVKNGSVVGGKKNCRCWQLGAGCQWGEEVLWLVLHKRQQSQCVFGRNGHTSKPRWHTNIMHTRAHTNYKSNNLASL